MLGKHCLLCGDSIFLTTSKVVCYTQWITLISKRIPLFRELKPIVPIIKPIIRLLDFCTMLTWIHLLKKHKHKLIRMWKCRLHTIKLCWNVKFYFFGAHIPYLKISQNWIILRLANWNRAHYLLWEQDDPSSPYWCFVSHNSAEVENSFSYNTFRISRPWLTIPT